MEEDDIEVDEPNTAKQGEASGSQNTPAHNDSSMTFEFVVNSGPNKSQIRRHAMRESWRQRNHGRSQSPVTNTVQSRARELLPRAARMRQSSLSKGKEVEVRENSDVEVDSGLGMQQQYALFSGSESPDPESVKQENLLCPNSIYIDLRHTITPKLRANNSSSRWAISGVPRRPSPYQSIGDAEPDPFNILQLSRDDKELLHHWISFYSREAYGAPTDPIFDPIRNAFSAVDLGERACVHATLAHAASHIAFLRQERSNSIQAITHKMAAIRIINESMNDPVEAISDNTISGVCRLLSYERYWGTDPGWNLHRRGLLQMLEKRGGLSTFQSNWRLELRVHLTTLTSRPRWSKPAFASPGRTVHEYPSPENKFNDLQDYGILHSNFVNFFSDIAIVNPDTTGRYPAIDEAVNFLRSLPEERYQGTTRIMCLFYIAVIFKHTHQSHFDLSWLNSSLAMTEQIWNDSIETLRWMLLQGMGRGPDIPENLARTQKVAEVAKLLKVNSWRCLEDRYSNILLGGSSSGNENAPWNSNMFSDSQDG